MLKFFSLTKFCGNGTRSYLEISLIKERGRKEDQAERDMKLLGKPTRPWLTGPKTRDLCS